MSLKPFQVNRAVYQATGNVKEDRIRPYLVVVAEEDAATMENELGHVEPVARFVLRPRRYRRCSQHQEHYWYSDS